MNRAAQLIEELDKIWPDREYFLHVVYRAGPFRRVHTETFGSREAADYAYDHAAEAMISRPHLRIERVHLSGRLDLPATALRYTETPRGPSPKSVGGPPNVQHEGTA